MTEETSPLRTLGAARAQAQSLATAGDYPESLRLTAALLGAFPHADELRFDVADLLARAGLAAESAALYAVLGPHAARTGRPLRAVVAARQLAALGAAGDLGRGLLDEIVDGYAAGSPRLARFAARPAPFEPGLPLPEGLELSALTFPDLVERARALAADLTGRPAYAAELHPIPFLSELAPGPFGWSSRPWPCAAWPEGRR